MANGSGARRLRPNLQTVCAIALAVAFAGGCSSRPGNPLRIATGYVSHVLCSEVFVSGQDPERDYAENIAAMGSYAPIRWALHHEVDRNLKEVRTRVFGGFETRSVFREGLGCLNVNGTGPVDAPSPSELAFDPALPAPLLADIAGAAVVEPADPGLRVVLDWAFTEQEGVPVRWTHGVVIVHDGKIIAERYAPGWTKDTPLHGWSASKSITNALIGILVRQGKLAVDQPAPVAAWQSPGDPRHAITVDNLLRMQSGLDLGNSFSAGLSAAWNTASRATFNERDPAGFDEAAAAATAPGSDWNYSNGNTTILMRIIRDLAGGHGADVLRFAQRELFAPLGMRSVVMELDATGTPVGGAFTFATARDWARFGQLFLQDGVAGGKRILPEGWTRYSARATPTGWIGYGAHWWTNDGDGIGAKIRIQAGMPADAYLAVGILGQSVVVVPSEHLVVARFGVTHDLVFANKDIAELVGRTVSALHAPNPGPRGK